MTTIFTNIKKTVLTTGLIVITLSSSILLNGCGASSNEQTHTIIGSVIGGAVGHQFGKGEGKHVMTVVGAVVGGMIAGDIGRELDQKDQQHITQTLESTPNYQKVTWNNQNTNTQYEFTPVNTYPGKINGTRTTCRDYVMDAWIDGQMQQVRGRACKNNQGQWINAS